MALLEMKPLCPAYPLADVRADYRTARRVGQYRVSSRALYYLAFPSNRYLSFEAVRGAFSKKTSMPLTGCCGKELPMVLLRVEYEGGFHQDFSFEEQKEADLVMEILRQNCPALAEKNA